jgi:hypothetical protein
MSAEVLDHLEWMIIRKEGPCGDRLATISKKNQLRQPHCISDVVWAAIPEDFSAIWRENRDTWKSTGGVKLSAGMDIIGRLTRRECMYEYT